MLNLVSSPKHEFTVLETRNFFIDVLKILHLCSESKS